MHRRPDVLRPRDRDTDDGFTLIELLVVVVIIGILIAIAIPLYLNYQKGAKDKSAQSDLRAAVSTVQQCYADAGSSYPKTVTFASSVGTPSATGCSGDKINASSGTTITYTSYTDNGTTACATEGSCTQYQLTAYNSGGNRTSGTPFTYKSWQGGNVN